MSVLKHELVDEDGASIDNLFNVDGTIIGSFGKDPAIIADNVRNVRELKLRDSDVMLCTPPKSGQSKIRRLSKGKAVFLKYPGTHWGYEIMSMLLLGKAEPIQRGKMELMLGAQAQENLDSCSSPRVLNIHLPYDQLPVQMKEKKTKTVLILRNPKDTAVSFYHHNKSIKHYNYSGKFEPFLKWFMEGKLECNCWFKYVKSFEKGMESNEIPIHLVYFEDLKQDPVTEIKKMATFLGVAADDALCQAIAKQCDFKAMEERSPYKSMTGFMNEDGSIFRKGIIGDWKNHLTVAQNVAFDTLYKSKMADSKLKFRFE